MMKNENQNPKAKLKALHLELKNAKDALNLTGEEDLFLPLIAKLEIEIEEVQETPKRKLGKLRAKLKTLEEEFFNSKDSSLSESINKLKEQIGDLENTIGLRTKKILVLVTDSEREKLKKRAARAGITLNRFLVSSALKTQSPMTTEDIKALTEVRFELRRLVISLNESARNFDNSITDLPSEPPHASVNSLLLETQNIVRLISKKL